MGSTDLEITQIEEAIHSGAKGWCFFGYLANALERGEKLSRKIRGIVAYPARRSGVDILPFKSDELVLVCPPDHPLAGFQRIDLRKLTGQRYIAFDRDIPTRRAIDRILRENAVHVTVAMEFDNIETIKRAIEIGTGISILPRMTVEREVALGALTVVPFAKPSHSRPLGILVKRGREIPIAMQRFLDVLLESRPA
jgi:DNA-binding transcriptional LysR family regulator